MLRGIYAAGSGMLLETIRADAIPNNLANANTAGYKKDIDVSKDFASLVLNRVHDRAGAQEIGAMGAGAVISDIVTVHSNGIMQKTGNKLDLAIDGKGYFAVQTLSGVRYTRNGQFAKSANGELVTNEGNRVLSQTGGPISLQGSNINISGDGQVYIDNVETDHLQVVELNNKQLKKEGSSLYQSMRRSSLPKPLGRLSRVFWKAQISML